MNEVRNVGGAKPPAKSSAPEQQKKPAKSFRETLQEKKTETQPLASPLQPQPFEFRPEEIEPAAPVQGSSQVDTVAAIEALAAEMVERVDSMGPAEVRIEFQPAVLDGVVATVRRDGADLEVRFETATPEAATLLSGNSAVLADRLERRGYAARIAVARRELRQMPSRPQPREQQPR